MNGRKMASAGLMLLPVVMLLWACRNTPEAAAVEENPNLETILPGTWEAVSVYVEVSFAGGQADSSYVFRINDGDWQKIFSVSPPRTYFLPDHKFRIEYRDRQDSIISLSRGIWNVFGDTLMMIEPDQTFQYQVSYDKGLIFFRGFRDWDADGAEDDRFQEVRRRISIGAE